MIHTQWFLLFRHPPKQSELAPRLFVPREIGHDRFR